MKKPMKRRPAAPGGKDTHTIVMQLALLLILIFRIPLGRLIGDKGIACFGTAAEIFAAVAGMLSFGLSEAGGLQGRKPVKKGQLPRSLLVLRPPLAAGYLFFIVPRAAAGLPRQPQWLRPLPYNLPRPRQPS